MDQMPFISDEFKWQAIVDLKAKPLGCRGMNRHGTFVGSIKIKAEEGPVLGIGPFIIPERDAGEPGRF